MPSNAYLNICLLIPLCLQYGASQGLTMYTNALAFYAGIRLIGDGKLSLQSMFTVLMAIMMTATGMGRASAFTATFEKAKNSAITTFELIDRVPRINPDLEGAEPETIQGDVELQGIRFAYPARPDVEIFKGDFGFKAKHNTSVALVVSILLISSIFTWSPVNMF